MTDWFHDSFAWHYRKWFGFNHAQADFAVHAQTLLCGAFICAVIPLLFWKLIGLVLLIAAVWCLSRIVALRTIASSAAGSTGTATSSRHAPSAVANAPAADTKNPSKLASQQQHNRSVH